MSTAFAGTAPFTRATAKFDRHLLAPWVVIVTALASSSALIYPWVFPDQSDRTELALAIHANPAVGMIFGPAFDLTTTDGFSAWRGLALGGFLLALGMIFAVTRATRAQEDSGQAELFASGVLGREARLLTGVLVALVVSVVTGVLSGLVTVLCGGGWEASMLLGATFTATAWMFVGVAAITAQLGGDARTANSMAVATLGVLFLARGIAYSVEAPDWVIWVNPLGWMTETRPATESDWWPLIPAFMLTGFLLGIAFALQSRRDFGQGAIAQRPGPARGRVRGPMRLALRLNRGSLLAWTIAFVVLGVVFGFFATSLTDILQGNAAVSSVLAAGATTPEALAAAFLTTILSLIGIIASVPGVQLMVKVRTEELDNRVEPILAASVSRPRYFGANIVLAFTWSAIFTLIAATMVAWLASGADLGIAFSDALLQGVATVPAVWTVVAVSVAVVGARPRLIIAAWAGVLLSFVLTLLGPTFKLWDWVLAISPFWHVPEVGTEGSDGLGLVWISLVTLALLAIGLAGFRRRDLVS